MNNLSKKQIEQAFELFHSDLIEEGLTLIDNQPNSEHGLNTHLTFKDKDDQRVLLEIKQTTVSKSDLDHLLVKNLKYKLFKTRIILAAPFIPKTSSLALEKNGIEFIQYSKDDIHNLYENSDIKIENETSSTPKSNDGNVAFKVKYNNEDWSHVFDEELVAYNFKHQTWSKEEVSSALNDSILDEDTSLDLPTEEEFDANIAISSLHAKMGKMAVFTSLASNQKESERFIFAIAQMNHIEPSDDNEETIEGFHCNKETAIIFKSTRPKFWKYYSNSNPDLKAWNMGLFRYLTDKTVISILKDVADTNVYPNTFKEKAKILLDEI
ncbi:hypothetical protein NMK71_08525 [Weeksellaceae bacterium KMM 9713]|uniref:Uncharacterized protein n=1 Tax=Profundicola chukchiensis TaxID=2961959 RepID=A0A9X4N0H3_9FLAO|nr:hypothetical protein [Profundicola chukchiensis]MDG4946457.1 hypothetical protein [Profundicola chukchiensis]